MKKKNDPMLSHINVGTGVDCTIRELTEIIAGVVGFRGKIVFDASKPDGTLRKLMDVDLLKELGWSSSIKLKQGIEDTYRWYLLNKESCKLC